MSRIRQEFSKPPRSRPEAQRQGRQMAEIVREGLRLGADEIGDLADLIEMHFAADVVLSPLGTDTDGLCAHADGRAVIVASSSFDHGHSRFTLAHELGHHLLADPRQVIDEPEVSLADGTLAERRVSAFAAYLLIPADGVAELLSWLSVEQIEFDEMSRRALRAVRTLVRRYGASPAATLYQLADLGYVSAPHSWLDRFPIRSAANSPQVRPPRRLLDGAIEAAVARKTGTGPLAVLLERDDEDELFEEYVALDGHLS